MPLCHQIIEVMLKGRGARRGPAGTGAGVQAGVLGTRAPPMGTSFLKFVPENGNGCTVGLFHPKTQRICAAAADPGVLERHNCAAVK